jgi:RNA polymerase sigma-70 factor (sigma-E family)
VTGLVVGVVGQVPVGRGRKGFDSVDNVRARTAVFSCVTTVMKHRPAGTASGAEQDFRAFVQGIAASLHRTAYLMCGDWHLADDLVQEALAKAYSHWRKVQGAENPSAYVRRILINESRRSWRRNRTMTAHPDDRLADLAVDDMSNGVVNRAELLHALQSLSPRQRATVVLRFLEGLSERETAAVLGCGEGTVKSQTSRALIKLKSVLKQGDI